jgi:coproporphyrinogen III oxidase
MKTALECGACVWNGADFYGTPNANSLHLINRYFTKYPEDADKVVLCIKGGVSITGIATFHIDCSAEAMRKSVDNANKILDGKKFPESTPRFPSRPLSKALRNWSRRGRLVAFNCLKSVLTQFGGRLRSTR